MAGRAFQDRFLYWVTPPVPRRLPGVRQPASDLPEPYLFPPFGLGPCQGGMTNA